MSEKHVIQHLEYRHFLDDHSACHIPGDPLVAPTIYVEAYQKTYQSANSMTRAFIVSARYIDQSGYIHVYTPRIDTLSHHPYEDTDEIKSKGDVFSERSEALRTGLISHLRDNGCRVGRGIVDVGDVKMVQGAVWE